VVAVERMDIVAADTGAEDAVTMTITTARQASEQLHRHLHLLHHRRDGWLGRAHSTVRAAVSATRARAGASAQWAATGRGASGSSRFRAIYRTASSSSAGRSTPNSAHAIA